VAYTDINALHNPATNTSPPASWGDGVHSNFEWLNPVAASYTPTLAQGASSNIAKTINEARYVRVGSWVFWWVHLSATAAGTSGAAVTWTLPVTASGHATSSNVGAALFYDASGSTRYQGGAELVSTTTVGISADGAYTGLLGANPSLAVASGDIIRASGYYLA
jgi:hypothetical protein